MAPKAGSRLKGDKDSLQVREPIFVEAYEHVQQLRKLANEILDMTDDDPQKALKRRELMEATIELRLLNRQSQQLVKTTKEETARRRQDADKTLLEIQNLQYQHKHLRAEIAKCERIEPKSDALDLIPEEEFLEENPDMRELSSHDLMMARLRDEEKRRLQLFVVKSRLTEHKAKLTAAVNEMRDNIEDRDAVDRMFSTFLNGAEDLQRYFHKQPEGI